MCLPPTHARTCTSTTLASSLHTSHVCTDYPNSHSCQSRTPCLPILYRTCIGMCCCRIHHCRCTSCPSCIRCAGSTHQKCPPRNRKRERWRCTSPRSDTHTSCILPQSNPRDSSTESSLMHYTWPRRAFHSPVCFSPRISRCLSPLRSTDRTCMYQYPLHHHRTRPSHRTQGVDPGCSPGLHPEW